MSNSTLSCPGSIAW